MERLHHAADSVKKFQEISDTKYPPYTILIVSKSSKKDYNS